MKTVLFLLFLTLSSLVQAGCFSEHVKKARTINKQRVAVYQELELGSEKPLEKLIKLELFLMPFAKFYDYKFKKWQDKGVDVLCSSIPDFSSIKTPNVSSVFNEDFSSSMDRKKLKAIKKELKKTLKRKGLKKFSVMGENYLTQFFTSTNANCLYRHFLESAIKISKLAVEAISELPQSDKKKLEKDVEGLISFHLFGLGWAGKIDQMAKAYQKRGVSVICAELPIMEI